MRTVPHWRLSLWGYNTERRGFLRAAAASLLAALTPFKQESAARVIDAIAFDFKHPKYIEEVYALSRSVLMVEESPAFLIQDSVLMVAMPNPSDTSDTEYKPTFELLVHRIVGPYGHLCRFFSKFSDITEAATNDMKLGMNKTDGTTLWIGMGECIITSINASYVAGEGDEKMMMTEQLQIKGHGIPVITNNSRTKPITMATQEEITKALIAPSIPLPL